MSLYNRPLTIGPPISLTYRGFFTTASSGTNANGVISSIGPASEDRNLVLLGKCSSVPKAMYFAGQQMRVQYTANDAQGTPWAVASGFIPKEITGVLALSATTSTSYTYYAFTITGLASSIPIATSLSSTALDTTRFIDLETKAGGVIVAVAQNNVSAGQSCTWTGDQNPTENNESTSGGIFTAANIINTVDDAANTITATYAVISTTHCTLIGASFR